MPQGTIARLYGTLRFLTAFTSACHLSLSWARSIQSIPPHPTGWRSILILSSHLRLALPIGLFLSGFPTKPLYTSLLSPYVLHALSISFFSTFITRSILVSSTDHEAPHYAVYHPINIGWAVQIMKLLIMQFITRSILGEQYRSWSSSLCSFLHFPVTSSLLGPNILLNNRLSNTLSLRSSLNVSDQVSHPYTTGKTIPIS